MRNTKRMIILALLVAMASVLHIVESWLPLPVPVPGVKLGLANIISLFVIVAYGWRDAVAVAVLRVLIGSLFGGTFFGPAFAMSLSGALFSLLAMAYAKRHWHPFFSLIGISVIGAVVHNLAQMSVAAWIVSSAGLLWYVPYLLLFALPTGVATGITTVYLLAKVPRLE